jgi:hypothetical protein
MKRVLSRRGAVPVSVQFLEPLEPAETGDRKALAMRSREVIVEALGRRSSPSAPPADRL